MKNLSLTSSNGDLIHGTLISIFEKNTDLVLRDLHRQQNDMCDRLNGMGLPQEIIKLLPIKNGKEGTSAFLMYHMALLGCRMVNW